MARRRSWIVAAATLAVLGGAAATVGAVAVDDGHDAYDHRLVRFDDDAGERNRYVNLEDGRAQLSLGSPDGHRVVVQWRDPDGHGWTAPETVWTDPRNTAIDSTVRYGGGTVAIIESFSTDLGSEDDTDQVAVGIVCRDRRCTARRAPLFGDPQVTPDGRAAYLGEDRRGAWLWSADGGIRRVPWSGHPGFDYRTSSPSRPLLAPDGSLRVVASTPARGACRFALLVAPPGTADLVESGRATVPLRTGSRSDCRTYLDTYSPDWVTVHPEEPREPTFWFVRDGDTWSTTDHDPSGLRLVERRHGCCATSVIGFLHWNDLAFGSPDGHRIQVQRHLLGEETWSAPQLLDGAPDGDRCTWLDAREVGDGTVLVMSCRSPGARATDTYAVAATTDLQHWSTELVTGATAEPVVDGDRLTVGDLTWTPTDGFARR